MREALDLLKPILEDEAVLKIVQNAKFDMVALARYGIALAAVDDPCLMSYALDAGRAEHLPRRACRQPHRLYLPHRERGAGLAAATPCRLRPGAVARATEYAGEETDIGLRLWMMLKPRLAAESVTTVYETLERPLAPVLAQHGARRRQGRARDAGAASPARSPRPSRGSRTRSASLPARTSISARPSSSATSCSAR